MAAGTCPACGSGFLAALHDDEPPLLLIPGVGDLTRLSRRSRLLLALGLVLAVLVPLALVTLLLTGRPADGTTHPPGIGTTGPIVVSPAPAAGARSR